MTNTGSGAIKWIAAAVVLVGLGVAGGYWWAHRTMPSDEFAAMGANAGNAPGGNRKVLYWHDPMVPSVKFDKPGKSPFMDMQLVPVYADEAGGGSDVRVDPSVAQNLGIRLGKVEKTMLTVRVRAVGSIAFDERLLEVVQSRVEGYITRLRVKAALERVRRGQALAEILAPQWVEAEQEYLALLDASSERARVMRDAARQRLVVLGVPASTIHTVETTRKTSAATTVSSPIDGVITELGVREGASFMPGASLFSINGLATVWANAQIPEARVSSVPVGSTVEATATAWPGIQFKGQVIALLPQVDPMTRTLTARVAIDNLDFKLSPGMFVALEFAAPAQEPQLVVPSEALIATGERSVIVVAREGGGFDVVNVSTGAEQDGYTVILSGLTEGQSIVLSGQFLLDSEASLKSTVNRLESAATAAPAGTMETMQSDPPGGDDAAKGAHTTRGTITATTKDSVTIAHEPVPSLDWPAMTMGFAPPSGGLPKDLKVGDRVRFSFTARDDGSFQLHEITVLDQPTAREQRP